MITERERSKKEALLAKPKGERKAIAEKSRELAMTNPKFVAESQHLISKDIKLKTPEEVVDERS